MSTEKDSVHTWIFTGCSYHWINIIKDVNAATVSDFYLDLNVLWALNLTRPNQAGIVHFEDQTQNRFLTTTYYKMYV